MASQIPAQLIPRSKPYEDISCYKRRVRWTQGNLSQSGNNATIVLPNEDAISLSLRVRFDVTVTGAANSTNVCPEFLASTFFQRIMMKIGGSVVVDWDQFHLQQSVFNTILDPNEQRGVYGYYQNANAAQVSSVTREGQTTFSYDMPLQINSGSLFANGRQLLPLFLLPRCELIFYTNENASCTSSLVAPSTYQLSNLELGATYYTSQAVKNYFSSVPYELSFNGITHRTQVLSAGQQSFNLAIPSNYRSLRALVAVFRPQGVENDFTATNKHITYEPLGASLKWNVRVNGFLQYQQELDSRSQMWQEVKRTFGPRAEKSRFYELGSEYSGDKFVMVSKLNCMNDAITGARTNQHVSSLELLIDSGTPLAQNLRMDLFLIYDKLLSISGGSLSIIQ
jgi:hypothetical protein